MKTYSHLEGKRRLPSEYELLSSRLLYHRDRGVMVDTPVTKWHEQHDATRTLQLADWGAFADPRETTYARYTSLQAESEAVVQRLLNGMARPDYYAATTPGWREEAVRALAPLRFAWHGLQMAVAYLGQMAPEGRIVITCALQAADELRRIERLAQWTLIADPAHDAAQSRAAWEGGDAWQPWRRLIERLLVTYDWGEAFVALQLVVKPALDELVGAGFQARARAAGDQLLAEMLAALEEDLKWQRAWSESLAALLEGDGDNARTIAAWRIAWTDAAAGRRDA